MSVSSEYADEDGMHKRRHKVLVSHKELQGVPTNLENLELSGNFVNLEKSGKSQGIWDMVREFFVTCHMVRDLLIDELIFACNV